jgi:rhodanese-related sulfurtransferase
MFVICQGGVRSQRSAPFLRQMQLGQVAGVRGGSEAWRAAGKPLAFAPMPAQLQCSGST